MQDLGSSPLWGEALRPLNPRLPEGKSGEFMTIAAGVEFPEVTVV
jgi:hypothetical protein